MDLRAHWESVYAKKQAEEVSWFQAEARLSAEVISGAAPHRGARILDVGGGASYLARDLLSLGYRNLTVLDLASGALSQARDRSPEAARQVSWVVGDVLRAPFASGSFHVWHDRAVFHFLTDREDRDGYVAQVRRCVRPGGLVLVATFAADGPDRCSGLPVSRYAPRELHAVFGRGFEPVTSRRELHHTPSGGTQAFTYCLCRRTTGGPDRESA